MKETYYIHRKFYKRDIGKRDRQIKKLKDYNSKLKEKFSDKCKAYNILKYTVKMLREGKDYE